MALESDHCENTNEIYCTIEDFFNSERATILFYIQTPNEVVNRNSVMHMRCSNESGTLHV